jgi:hypothetical protein
MANGSPAETSVHFSLSPESELAPCTMLCFLLVLQEISSLDSSNTEPEHAPEVAFLLLLHYENYKD